MTTNDERASLSEKIENTVEGFLRFLSRYFYTHWTMFRHPISATEILLNNLDNPSHSRRFSRPLTFLMIGGFIFTLIFSILPYGFSNIANFIWFNEEIVDVLYERWEEALSVTGLLTAAFPVLITVTALSTIYARWIFDEVARGRFIALNSYVFGFFSFFFFSIFMMVAFGELMPHFGVSVPGNVTDVPVYFTLAVLAVIVVYSMFFPIIAVTKFSFKEGSSSQRKKIAGRVLAVPYSLFLLYMLTYAASIPGAFQEIINQKLPRVVLHKLSGPDLAFSEVATAPAVATLSYSLIFDNQLEDALIVSVEDVRTQIRLFVDGELFDHKDVRHSSAVDAAGTRQEFIFVKENSASKYFFSQDIAISGALGRSINEKLVNTKNTSDDVRFDVTFSASSLGGDSIEEIEMSLNIE